MRRVSKGAKWLAGSLITLLSLFTLMSVVFNYLNIFRLGQKACEDLEQAGGRLIEPMAYHFDSDKLVGVPPEWLDGQEYINSKGGISYATLTRLAEPVYALQDVVFSNGFFSKGIYYSPSILLNACISALSLVLSYVTCYLSSVQLATTDRDKLEYLPAVRLFIFTSNLLMMTILLSNIGDPFDGISQASATATLAAQTALRNLTKIALSCQVKHAQIDADSLGLYMMQFIGLFGSNALSICYSTLVTNYTQWQESRASNEASNRFHEPLADQGNNALPTIDERIEYGSVPFFRSPSFDEKDQNNVNRTNCCRKLLC